MNTLGPQARRRTPSRVGSLIIFAILVTAVGFSVMPTSSAQTAFGPSNPFYAPSTLPFQAPPFDKIKDSDYEPAFDAGMAQQLKEMQAIADNPEPPTFENTFVAMEKSGRLLNRVEAAFNDVSQANLDDALQKVRDIDGAQTGGAPGRHLPEPETLPANRSRSTISAHR